MEPSTSGTGLNTLFITRKELIDNMKCSGKNNFSDQYDFMLKELEHRTSCDLDILKQKLSKFKYEYRTSWLKACRIEDKFKKYNKEWLETALSFPRFTKQLSNKKRGRQPTPFELCAERTKRSKTKKLRDSVPTESLIYASCMNLRAEGQAQASKLIKNIATNLEQAGIYQQTYQKSLEPQKVLSGENALAVLIDAKLSREQYGPEIISSALLPIDQLTEESQEARNKDFKRYREFNSRKCSRDKSNRDIFNFFLLSSDPVISSKRNFKRKKQQNLPKEALDLLKSSYFNKCHINNTQGHVDDDNEDNDTDDDDDDGALTYL